jgi:hypothetical protein
MCVMLPMQVLRAHVLPLTNCAYNKSGDKFITGSYDRTCKVRWINVACSRADKKECWWPSLPLSNSCGAVGRTALLSMAAVPLFAAPDRCGTHRQERSCTHLRATRMW